MDFQEYRKFITKKYLSAEFLDEYPVVESYGELILRPETLALIDPYIDWRFFTFIEVTLRR